jgi:phage terminase small subunit
VIRAAGQRRALEATLAIIDPDGVLRLISQIAQADPRRIFDAQGRLLPVREWPDDVAACIASIEVVKRNVYSDDGAVDDVIKIKHWDKMKALEMAAKHYGLLIEKLQHSGGIEVSWAGDE